MKRNWGTGFPSNFQPSLFRSRCLIEAHICQPGAPTGLEITEFTKRDFRLRNELWWAPVGATASQARSKLCDLTESLIFFFSPALDHLLCSGWAPSKLSISLVYVYQLSAASAMLSNKQDRSVKQSVHRILTSGSLLICLEFLLVGVHHLDGSAGLAGSSCKWGFSE